MLRDRDTEKWIKAAEMKVAASRKDAVVGHYVVQGAPKSPRNREYRRERDEIKRGERVQTEREKRFPISLSLFITHSGGREWRGPREWGRFVEKCSHGSRLGTAVQYAGQGKVTLLCVRASLCPLILSAIRSHIRVVT